MDLICNTVFELCVLVSICALCLQMLPSSAMRSAIQMACGLMLLHIMLSNLLGGYGLYVLPEEAAWMKITLP